jgi:single-strand DNA-binding protein
MSLNRVMVIRNLGQDPEIRYTVSTMETVLFRRNWISEPALTKLLLTCNEYLNKGRGVLVEGRLQTREWEANGQNNHRTEIVATRVQFLGARPVDAGVEDIDFALF